MLAVVVGERNEFASQVAGAVGMVVLVGLSIGATVVTGGAATPFTMAMITAASGGSALGARFLIEGPGYVTQKEVADQVVQTAVEGLTDAATGGAVGAIRKGLGQALRGIARHAAKEVAENAARAAAREALDAATEEAVEQAAKGAGDQAGSLAGDVVQGIVEGMAAGAAGEVAMTASDAAVWDQSLDRALAELKLAAIRGGLFGGAMGGGASLVFGGLARLAQGLVGLGASARDADRYANNLNREGLAGPALENFDDPRLQQALFDYSKAKEDGRSPQALRDILADAVGGDHPVVQAFDRTASVTALEAELYRTVTNVLVGEEAQQAARDALSQAVYYRATPEQLAQQPAGTTGWIEVRTNPRRFEVYLTEDADGLDLREEVFHISDLAQLSDEQLELLDSERLRGWAALDVDQQRATWELVADLEIAGIGKVLDALRRIEDEGGPLSEAQLRRRAELEDRLEQWRRQRDDLATTVPDGPPLLRSSSAPYNDDVRIRLRNRRDGLEEALFDDIIPERANVRWDDSEGGRWPFGLQTLNAVRDEFARAKTTVLAAESALEDLNTGQPVALPTEWEGISFTARALRELSRRDVEIKVFATGRRPKPDVHIKKVKVDTDISFAVESAVRKPPETAAARAFLANHLHSSDFKQLHAETDFVINFIQGILDSGVSPDELLDYLRNLKGTVRIHLATPMCQNCFWGLDQFGPRLGSSGPRFEGAIPTLSELAPNVVFEIGASRRSESFTRPISDIKWTLLPSQRAFYDELMTYLHDGFLLYVQNGAAVRRTDLEEGLLP